MKADFTVLLEFPKEESTRHPIRVRDFTKMLGNPKFNSELGELVKKYFHVAPTEVDTTCGDWGVEGD